LVGVELDFADDLGVGAAAEAPFGCAADSLTASSEALEEASPDCLALVAVLALVDLAAVDLAAVLLLVD
jgi:hypothetical protein